MANRQSREALYRTAYRTNGAAAYDVRAYRGTEAPELPRRTLPEERPQPVRRVRVRAKTAVSPFAVLGALAAACMMVLVIFGYVQLYEATSQAGDLAEELESMQQQNQLLRSDYEGRIDLGEVEKRAIRELGMIQPTSAQTVYVDLVSADRAEILQEEEVNKLAEAVSALKSSVEGLVSYLS
ncbi:MAG: hypothetical protein HFF17_08080 [Oscillospiraceae bacterium]|nr:hypothetical protein [Oscillospiraceae bacterium]